LIVKKFLKTFKKEEKEKKRSKRVSLPPPSPVFKTKPFKTGEKVRI